MQLFPTVTVAILWIGSPLDWLDTAPLHNEFPISMCKLLWNIFLPSSLGTLLVLGIQIWYLE
jgi:hypothetical protein